MFTVTFGDNARFLNNSIKSNINYTRPGIITILNQFGYCNIVIANEFFSDGFDYSSFWPEA